MLVKFLADGTNKRPIWIEADLVRIIATTENGNEGSVLYQADSDTPYFVIDKIEDVVKAVNEGKSK